VPECLFFLSSPKTDGARVEDDDFADSPTSYPDEGFFPIPVLAILNLSRENNEF
jgi:hypothetical protein